MSTTVPTTTPLKIAALAGDGIGPEIMPEAIKVLRAIERKFDLQLEITEAPVGWAAIDKEGKALPDSTIALCRKSRAVLVGAVGLHYRDPEITKEKRPERALLRLRKQLGLFANLRPIRLYPELADACPLRPERQGDGIDILVVRESSAGLYYGYPRKTEAVMELKDAGKPAKEVLRAVDTMAFTVSEIERIAHVALRAAWLRKRKVTSVDKANILETSILWRKVVTDTSHEYPHVVLENMLVDTAAMQLVLRPAQFDVLLCESTFGEILCDEAAALVGSLGMLPSAHLGYARDGKTFGLYEPAGGTAPDIAGKGLANPIAQILAAALMLRYTFELDEPAKAIETAVCRTIAAGYRTNDIFIPGDANLRKVGTSQMGDAIAGVI
ncbi:MAG TPA: 3-isopropylmalate dehydrogenase [Verrucomicrobiae bacterium]